MPDLPAGTVTYLFTFTDNKGSTAQRASECTHSTSPIVMAITAAHCRGR